MSETLPAQYITNAQRDYEEVGIGLFVTLQKQDQGYYPQCEATEAKAQR